MKLYRAIHQKAFTRNEALVVAGFAAFLVLGLRPAFQPVSHRKWQGNCENQMRQIDIAFQIWRNDNNDKFPMDIPVSLGGAREPMVAGNVAACFQIMSNELATPRLLLCPRDYHHYHDGCSTGISLQPEPNASP